MKEETESLEATLDPTPAQKGDVIWRLAKLAAEEHEKTVRYADADMWPYIKEGWTLGWAAGYEAALVEKEPSEATTHVRQKEPELMSAALRSVLTERKRQDEKWGEQNLDPFAYLTVLVEEVGELAQAALHHRFGGPEAFGVREEATHVAAVAIAIVECIDRAKWKWPIHAGESAPSATTLLFLSEHVTESDSASVKRK